jgi:hypothetical protein
MTLRWLLLDETIQDPPVYIKPPDDRCYYAREYISKGGFKSSEANQLISNFKKSPDRRGKPEWHYKEQAIRQFAEELSDLLGKGCIVSHIPSSKAKDDPEYDSRLEDTLDQLGKIRSDLRIVEAITLPESMDAYHTGGTHTRHPDEIYEKIRWKGLPTGANHVVLIDDLVTSGAHFKACKRLILERSPGIEVIGAFWAKTIWPAPPPTG